MREFKDSISGKDDDDDHQPELTQSSTPAETPAPPPSQPREHDKVP